MAYHIHVVILRVILEERDAGGVGGERGGDAREQNDRAPDHGQSEEVLRWQSFRRALVGHMEAKELLRWAWPHQITAIAAIIALLVGAGTVQVAVARPAKAESENLRAELNRMKMETAMLRKQLTNLATASSRQKKPAALLEALASSSIPAKQRVMSPSKAKAARERNVKRKAKKATAAAAGKGTRAAGEQMPEHLIPAG